jgi:hypothetical protein
MAYGCFEQYSNSYATTCRAIERGNNARDGIGDEAHEEEVRAGTTDQIKKYLLGSARRNQSARWASPDQFYAALTLHSLERPAGANQHASYLTSVKLRLTPRHDEPIDGSACCRRIGQSVRVEGRIGSRQSAKRASNCLSLHRRHEDRKINDRVEKRLH